MGRRYEIEIVGRRVVLGILAMRRAAKASHGEIESRRAILPLVVAVRRKISYRKGDTLGLEYMLDGAVDIGALPSAALVVERPAVAGAGEHEPVLDPLDCCLVPEQPRERADRSRHKQKAVGVAARE